MSFKHIECDQGTDEWFKARLGKVTASMFSSVITKTGKRSSSIEELVNKAVAELIIGEPDETFQSPAMIRGTQLEKDAFDFVNFVEELNFKECGFLDTEKGYGCSPDGLDEENKIGLELKCPMAHTHLGYLTGGALPAKYMQQVQGSMLVSGYDKWVFASYHPDLPGFTIVVERDQEFIDKLEPLLVECGRLIEEKYNFVKEKLL